MVFLLCGDYMNGEIDCNNAGLYQLKECYEMSVLYSSDEVAKSVLREKAKTIDIPKTDFPIQNHAVYEEMEKNTFLNAFYELSLVGNAGSIGNLYSKLNTSDSFTDSGEKELILAILSLRKGTKETNRIEAIGHLSAAHALAPNDPRITSLINILEEQQG